MLYSIKNRASLEKVEELASFKNQVKELRLQGKLGKQNFHQDMKKFFEPLIDIIKDASRDKTKTMK